MSDTSHARTKANLHEVVTCGVCGAEFLSSEANQAWVWAVGPCLLCPVCEHQILWVATEDEETYYEEEYYDEPD